MSFGVLSIDDFLKISGIDNPLQVGPPRSPFCFKTVSQAGVVGYVTKKRIPPLQSRFRGFVAFGGIGRWFTSLNPALPHIGLAIAFPGSWLG